MGRKKNSDASAIILGIAILAMAALALLLPVLLLIGWLLNRSRARISSSGISPSLPDFSLSEAERAQMNAVAMKLEEINSDLEQQHKKGESKGLSVNKDGTFCRRSRLGKEIVERTEQLSTQRDRLESSLSNIQDLPVRRWQSEHSMRSQYNGYLRKSRASVSALLAWLSSIVALGFVFEQGSILRTFSLYWLIPSNVFRHNELRTEITGVDYGTLAMATATAIISYGVFWFVNRNIGVALPPKPNRVTVELEKVTQ